MMSEEGSAVVSTTSANSTPTGNTTTTGNSTPSGNATTTGNITPSGKSSPTGKEVASYIVELLLKGFNYTITGIATILSSLVILGHRILTNGSTIMKRFFGSRACVKTLLTFYNIFLVISGLAIAVFGLAILQNNNFLFELIGAINEAMPSARNVDNFGSASTALGVVVIGTGLYGSIGLFMENTWLIGTYILLLGIISLLEGGIGVGVFYYLLASHDRSTFNMELYNQWNSKYTSDLDYAATFDHAQVVMQCCGVNSPFDYVEVSIRSNGTQFQLSETYPTSCCDLSTINVIGQRNDQWYDRWNDPYLQSCRKFNNSDNTRQYYHPHFNQGCGAVMYNWQWNYATVVGATSGGLSLGQVLGILLSIWLVHNIRNGDTGLADDSDKKKLLV